MSESINLSIGRQEVKTEIKKHFLYSLVFLATIILITAILVGVNYIFSSRLDKLAAQEADLQARIQSQSAKAAKLVLLHNRLATISKITSGRDSLNTEFAQIIAMTPDSVSIESTDISSELVTVSFQSSNLSSLNDLLNGYYNLKKNDSKIKKVKVNSFGFAKEQANYKLDLDFLF